MLKPSTNVSSWGSLQPSNAWMQWKGYTERDAVKNILVNCWLIEKDIIQRYGDLITVIRM